MILDLQNIFKDYQQEKLVVPVLKDVTLQVEEGEYVAVMGPSGSGKTTLMNIIGCLDRPTSGTYQLAGEDVLRCKDREMSDLRLRSIGFVFQNFQLLSRQTALDNVALPLSYAGVKKKERRQRATQALERVGLGDRVTFKPTQLSGGQKQRVAIARAMVNNPQILLADEPTGALDSKSGEQIMELFEQLNEEGVTIVMITHDRNIASKAKRIVHIIDGIITEEGTLPGEDGENPEPVGTQPEGKEGTGVEDGEAPGPVGAQPEGKEGTGVEDGEAPEPVGVQLEKGNVPGEDEEAPEPAGIHPEEDAMPGGDGAGDSPLGESGQDGRKKGSRRRKQGGSFWKKRGKEEKHE